MRMPWLLVLLLPLSACSPTRRPERPRPNQAAPATGRDLDELVGLSQLVIVGAVEVREEETGGVFYRVRLEEVLSELPLADSVATHPAAKGEVLRVTSFLYRVGSPAGNVSSLPELSRYVFFLSPTEKPGEWLNLADPATYVLPPAKPTVDALRAKRRAVAEEGGDR